MADSALLKKLNVKPSSGMRLINVPANLAELLSVAEAAVSVVILFVYSVADLERRVHKIIPELLPGQYFWIAFPKKTSKIKTDISRDNGWEKVRELGYRSVNLIAIDDDWSAFRFQPVGTRVSLGLRDPYAPPAPRVELVVPQDLLERFDQNAAAKQFFDKLSYSCRKEYLLWIGDAKRHETRMKRLDSTVDKLLAGQRTPAR